MLLITFVILALSLTITMFALRQAMLGFPCGIFWFLAGAYSYSISTHLWTDPYYWLFFMFTLGMGLFTIFASFALRKSDIPEFAPGPPPDNTPEDTVNGWSADGEHHESNRGGSGKDKRQSDINKVFDTSSQPSSQSSYASSNKNAERRRVRVVPDKRPRGLRW